MHRCAIGTTSSPTSPPHPTSRTAARRTSRARCSRSSSTCTGPTGDAVTEPARDRVDPRRRVRVGATRLRPRSWRRPRRSHARVTSTSRSSIASSPAVVRPAVSARPASGRSSTRSTTRRRQCGSCGPMRRPTASTRHASPSAGTSAGAITALHVAYNSEDPGTSGNPGPSSAVRSAVSLSGARFIGPVAAADPPSLLFHGTQRLRRPVPVGGEHRRTASTRQVSVRSCTRSRARATCPFAARRSRPSSTRPATSSTGRWTSRRPAPVAAQQPSSTPPSRGGVTRARDRPPRRCCRRGRARTHRSSSGGTRGRRAARAAPRRPARRPRLAERVDRGTIGCRERDVHLAGLVTGRDRPDPEVRESRRRSR